MGVFDDLQKVAGTPYNRASYNKDLLDMVVLRRARERSIRLPTSVEPDVWNYFGAYVFPPNAGLNENVMYLDLASLYPNLMRALNVGPETIVGVQGELEASQWSEDDCVWSYIDTRDVKHLDSSEMFRDFTDGTYKMVYDPNANSMKWRDDPQYTKCYYLKPSVKEGFLRDIVQDLIDLKYQYSGGLYEAIKRIVNSVYGYVSYLTSSNSSRLADWRLGESITLAGRKVIQYTANMAMEYMEEEFGNDTYITIGDTDGCGITWESAPSRSVMLDRVGEAVEYINGEGYDSFMCESFNIPNDHYMDVEIESYAPSVFVPRDFDSDDPTIGVRKRYGQWVTLDESDEDDQDFEEVDDVEITGLEYVRSDVATVTQDVQYKVLKWILKEDWGTAWDNICEELRDVHERIENGEYNPNDIAKRGGIGQKLSEYGSENRSASSLYKGAKYADKFVNNVSLSQGSKPMAFYVDSLADTDLPPTYDADTAEDGDVVDVISVEDYNDLPEGIQLNYDKHVQKSLVEPMQDIIKTMGEDWDAILHSHSQSGLEQWGSA